MIGGVCGFALVVALAAICLLSSGSGSAAAVGPAIGAAQAAQAAQMGFPGPRRYRGPRRMPNYRMRQVRFLKYAIWAFLLYTQSSTNIAY